MTALVRRDNAVRAVAMRKSFATWTLGEGASERHRNALCATTLADAILIATPPMMPVALAKGGFPSFVILVTDDAAGEGEARHQLHFYTVKARREWRQLDGAHYPSQVAIPYAVHAGSLAMDAFQPRRPFDPFTDNPRNGRQPGEGRLIEAAAR